jgi:hypothetical protein
MPVYLLRLLREGVEARPWLERHLVGPDLLDVVRELVAVHGDGAGVDATPLLDRRSDILERGLGVLTEDEIQGLFRCPSLLLQVQEWVLLDGGPYWDGVLSGSAASPLTPTLSPRRPQFAYLWSILSHVGVAAAAVAIVWFLFWIQTTPVVPTRATPMAISSADAVLPILAEQLDQKWAALRRAPDTDAILSDLQETCDALAAAPFPQLSESARASLRRDLARLRREIEAQRRLVAQGGDPWRARAAVESRVNILISTRWRDPGDLPDAEDDPEDLPSSDALE